MIFFTKNFLFSRKILLFAAVFAICPMIFALDAAVSAAIVDDFSEMTDEKMLAYFAALSGAGDNDDFLDFYREKVKKIDADFATRMAIDAGFQENRALQAEVLLEKMHENFFSRYDLYSFTSGAIKNFGQFNCVSSSILYAALLLRNGISEIVPVETLDHVFIMLDFERQVDVETTNIYGFDPGRKKEFFDDFGEITGFSYVPPSNYRLRNELSLKQLLSLVARNRANQYSDHDEFERAFEQAEIVKKMRNDSIGDNDYAASLQNLINSYILQHKFQQAIDFLSKKMPQDHPQYRRLYDSVLFGFIEENNADGLYAAAFSKAQMILSPDIRNAAVNNICTLITQTALREKNYEAGISALGLAENFGFADSNEYRQNRMVLVNNICVFAIQAKNYERVKSIFYAEWKKGVVDREVLIQLFKSAITSEGSEYYARGEIEKSIASSKEGLRFAPDDETLRGNLKMLYSVYLRNLQAARDARYNAVLAEAKSAFPADF